VHPGAFQAQPDILDQVKLGYTAGYRRPDGQFGWLLPQGGHSNPRSNSYFNPRPVYYKTIDLSK
jgi:hypothetical protein